MKPNSVRCSQGFTLIELSIGLLILGIVMAAMLQWLAFYINNKQYQDTQDKLRAIEDALVRYYGLNGYLPCPAARTVAIGSASFGLATDCTASPVAGTADVQGTGGDSVRYGILPTRTLGLPDSDSYDGYGQRFTYLAIRGLAYSAASYNAYSTSLLTGVIKIVDNNNNQIPKFRANLGGSLTNEVVAYAVISHGHDARGAWSNSGAPFGLACGGTLDSINCANNDPPVIMDTVMSDAFNLLSTNPSLYYDDVVRWKTRADIIQASKTVVGGNVPYTPAGLNYVSTALIGPGPQTTCTVANDPSCLYSPANLSVTEGNAAMYVHNAAGDQLVVPAGATKVALYVPFIEADTQAGGCDPDFFYYIQKVGTSSIVATAQSYNYSSVHFSHGSMASGPISVNPGDAFSVYVNLYPSVAPCIYQNTQLIFKMEVVECNAGCAYKQ